MPGPHVVSLSFEGRGLAHQRTNAQPGLELPGRDERKSRAQTSLLLPSEPGPVPS